MRADAGQRGRDGAVVGRGHRRDVGEHLDAATRLLHLNSAIHMLEWQSHVTGHGEAWLQPLAA